MGESEVLYGGEPYRDQDLIDLTESMASAIGFAPWLKPTIGAAQEVLARLVAAGWRKVDGAVDRVEWTVRTPAGRIQLGEGSPGVGEDGRALMNALVAQWPGSAVVRRTASTSPDGSQWTGPWLPAGENVSHEHEWLMIADHAVDGLVVADAHECVMCPARKWSGAWPGADPQTGRPRFFASEPAGENVTGE